MTPDQKKVVKGYLEEMSNSMLRAEAERTLQREATKRISDEAQLDKKLLRRLARIYHKQNFTEEQQTNEELTELYETVVQN